MKILNVVAEPIRKAVSQNGRKLIGLWDGYSLAGYENHYRNHISQEHKTELTELFLPSTNKGEYLDLGCGTGNLFSAIVTRIRPSRVCAADWSLEMLRKAELESEKLRTYDTVFQFFQKDLSKPLDWPSGSFDGVISNLVICYLTCGWKNPLEEMARVLKPGGYLYLGVFLNNWGFAKVLWKHAIPEFLREPITSFHGLKYRRIISGITKEVRKNGAVFPSKEKLIASLKQLGFRDITITPTYWGGAIALRACLA